MDPFTYPALPHVRRHGPKLHLFQAVAFLGFSESGQQSSETIAV